VKRIALVLTLLVAACSHGSGPAAPTPTPTQPVVTPATPPPAPVLSSTCARLGPGVKTANCGDETPVLEDDVYGAIDQLQVTHPEIFNGDHVLNAGLYYMGVIQILDRRGICGVFEGEDFGVKRDNSFCEFYHILTGKGDVHRNKYKGSCSPASIPTPGWSNPGPPPAPGCSLPRSQTLGCGDAPSGGRFFNDVQAAIDQVLKEHPEIFDYGQALPGSRLPLVLDFPKYIASMETAMVQRGYCATWNGESMEVKKTNDFSEAYKIQYQDKWVRRDDKICYGICYPASF